MSYGPLQAFYGSIASGASTCTSIDLGTKAYSRKFVEISTCSTNSVMTVYGSSDNAVFRAVSERVNTAPVQYQGVTIATGVANGMAPLDVHCRYLQFRCAEVVSGGVSITVLCAD